MDAPPFETLVAEQVKAKWKTEVGPIADGFEQFRKAQSEIEAQLGAEHPGMSGYRPSGPAKVSLEKAATALRPVVAHLKAAGVRTRSFAKAVETLTALAGGSGSFSTDYATEELHQCFSNGVGALH